MTLPTSVRYIKNGPGGCWWKAAKAHGQVHAGWGIIQADLLKLPEKDAIERLIRDEFKGKQGATQDFNALMTLLNCPSQHVWITFQGGEMWWCTVYDGINTNNEVGSNERGHFWLKCATPWSNYSLGKNRHLVKNELPGDVVATSGFKGTVCEPKAWRKMLRIINNEADENVAEASRTREA